MGISISTRQSYTEIDNFIESLDEYNKNKIPRKLREYFKKEKDINYIKQINPDKSIKEQNFKKETLALIAILNLKYWCEDETEKQRLKQIYAQNEKKYKEALNKQYNPNNIFKNKNNYSKNVSEQDLTKISIVEYKEKSLIQKLFKKIKDLFIKK